MKAIQVKSIMRTETKPMRLKAWAWGDIKLVLPWDYNYVDGGRRKIAEELCDSLSWDYEDLHEGFLPNGDSCFLVDIG